MSAWNLYWLLMLDGITKAFMVAAVVSGVAAVLSAVAFSDMANDGDKDAKLAAKWFRVCAITCGVFVVAFTLTPSTKQAAVIFVAPKLANSEFVNETLPTEAKELYGLAKAWLKEQTNNKETSK